MKIQYCSDLHLEFPDNERFLKATPLKVEGNILILAGNHEYYQYDIADKGTVFNEKIRENVFLVNNEHSVIFFQVCLKKIAIFVKNQIHLKNEGSFQ